MAHAWINIIYMNDDDFKAEQEKRRARDRRTARVPQQQLISAAIAISLPMRHPAHATSELIDVVNLVTQAFWADLRRSGRAIEMSQWSTLRRIGRSPCTMSELARHKGVGLPTISKSVDMLVRRGWVERWVDKSDRRQTLVRLTAGGRRILAECRRRVEDLLEEKLGALSDRQREDLTTSLLAVRDALRAAT